MSIKKKRYLVLQLRYKGETELKDVALNKDYNRFIMMNFNMGNNEVWFLLDDTYFTFTFENSLEEVIIPKHIQTEQINLDNNNDLKFLKFEDISDDFTKRIYLRNTQIDYRKLGDLMDDYNFILV